MCTGELVGLRDKGGQQRRGEGGRERERTSEEEGREKPVGWIVWSAVRRGEIEVYVIVCVYVCMCVCTCVCVCVCVCVCIKRYSASG